MANDTATDSSVPAKIRQDMQLDELKYLNSLENWATSLFLGAIGLISKQILDWSNPAVSLSTKPLVLHLPMYLLPAAIGLVAFVYLRSLNFRIRKVRGQVYSSVPVNEDRNWWSLGLLGWFTSLIPLAFGYAATWYFGIDNPDVMGHFWTMVWLGATVLGVAVAVFICQGQCRNESREQ